MEAFCWSLAAVVGWGVAIYLATVLTGDVDAGDEPPSDDIDEARREEKY